MLTPFQIARRLASGGLLPRTRTAWFTLYLAGVELLLLLLKTSFRFAGALRAVASLDSWTGFLGLVLILLLAFLFLRWFRKYVMWRLRNRLIVTYLFIGGVPIILVVLMALSSAYLFSGQFASYLTVSEFRTQLQELRAANAANARHIAALKTGSGKAPSAQIKGDDTLFPGQTVVVLPESSAPKWLKDGFQGLVMDAGKVEMRAASMVSSGKQRLLIYSSVPLDQKFLARIAAGFGPLTLYVPPKDALGKDKNITVKHGKGVEINGIPEEGISAGTLPEAQFRGDTQLTYYAAMQLQDWSTGEPDDTVLIGTVRPSTLYSRLTVVTSKTAGIAMFILVGLAICFGLMVLIALFIGVRLTRTITRSVANLYEATRKINQGDLKHRIQVKEHDQLAELQVSFNSMTESLEKLIAEQKEKERLQSELEIAQEVQAQLFPPTLSGTRTLELHGVCRPARMVSGDYYDFLSYGSEQMGIAVGDISGKGISAALLMATIHSAVRAYEQEQLMPVRARPSSHEQKSGSVGLAIRQAPPQSAAQVLWLLNRQLYKSTAPEKYATLFLGFYDGQTRRMSYSNAGHLPPLILGDDGSTRRLDVGGTVVGLFDNMEYREATVDLQPGDIFVAFSDGITEPENEFGEFGEERLIETIETYRNLPLDRITDNVIAAVQDWIGSAEQPDDITLVLARPRG